MNKIKHKKAFITIVSTFILSVILVGFLFVFLHDEIVSSNYKEKQIENTYVKELIYDFKNGDPLNYSLTITKNPYIGNDSECIIEVFFNKQDNNDKYKITNLELSIMPKSGVTLTSIHCEGATTPTNVYEISDETYTVKADSDYLYLNITASDHYNDCIEFELKYDIYGQGIHSINKFKGLGVSVSQ